MSPSKKPPSKRARILFFLLGSIGFVVVFVTGLWLTLALPTVASWLLQGLFIIVFVYGYIYRLGAWLGIIQRKNRGTLEDAVIQHPLSYYLFKGLSLM